MLLHQRIRLRRAVRDGVLSLEQIGLVSVVDTREVPHSVNERRPDADIDALVRRQKICGEDDGSTDRIATGSELHRELLRASLHCF